METESPETIPEAEGDVEPTTLAPQLVSMIEHDGQEPPTGYPDRQAEAAWACVSALWHPAILADLDALPAVQGTTFPNVPEPREIRVVAEGAGQVLPADYRSLAADAGATLIDAGIDRYQIVRDVLGRLRPDSDPNLAIDDPLVLDFFALGTANWFLRDLTTAMNHANLLDSVGLARETFGGAKAWRDGDRTAASGHLRAAFELLSQSREKFYSVDAYLVDLCLIDPSFPAGALADPLSARAPFTFVGTARAIEQSAEIDPAQLAALREAVAAGWADVAGGTYDEVDEPFLPYTSILWQYLKGGEVYRRHLDDRNTRTLVTRRFALYPHRPQIARKFGFQYAVHIGFDAGRFPVPRESKRLWQGPDTNHLESLMRPPIAADRAAEGLHLPWKIGRSMRDDHVATVPMAHWPSPVAGWYRDLRRVSAYSPVLGRLVTLDDYFHMSDRPWEMFSPELDEYVTPYLAQAVARRDDRPVSRRAEHARARAGLDALSTIDALRRALTWNVPPSEDGYETRGPLETADLAFPVIEEAVETGQFGEAHALINANLPEAASGLASAILGTSGAGQAGYLALNPLGISRRVAVEIDDPTAEPQAGGPLRSVERTDVGFRGVVDLPPFGFAWFPKVGGTGAAPGGGASASGLVVKNESIEAEFDEATGGIRGIRLPGEPVARVGQQIVTGGLTGPDGLPANSRMECASIEVVSAGPTVAEIVSRGTIKHPEDGHRLGAFQISAKLWAGRSTLDLTITLEDLDVDWLAGLDSLDPWSSHVACRWAWPDVKSELRRTSLLSAFGTGSPRPETPDAFEITSRKLRTTLLFGGLAHHRRQGERMLDTILVAGSERAREFQLGVTLDREHAFSAATDFLAPTILVPVESGPPTAGPAGWLAMVETSAVQVARIEFLEKTGDNRGWGLAIHLIETAGRGVRSRLRLFRDPLDARQTDLSGELLYDLPTEGDAVPFDLTPHEIQRIEVRLG